VSDPQTIERLDIAVLSDAAVARSLVLRIALAHGLARRAAGELALAASELATNIVKYGGGRGQLEVVVEPGALVLVAEDRGAGPPSEAELFGDGISRGRPRALDQAISTGRGTGGGALRRLCDAVSVEAREAGGTRIRCAKRLGPGQGR